MQVIAAQVVEILLALDVGSSSTVVVVIQLIVDVGSSSS